MMCFAFRNNIIRRIGGGKMNDLDFVYDEEMELHNRLDNVTVNHRPGGDLGAPDFVRAQNYSVTKEIDIVDSKIDLKQKSLDKLIEQYELIAKHIPYVSIIYPFIHENSDVNILKRIPSIVREIKEVKHEISNLNRIKQILNKKSKPIEDNIQRVDSFLHKDFAKIDTILQHRNSGLYIQYSGKQSSHSFLRGGINFQTPISQTSPDKISEDKYKSKYLKYKQKYLELKQKFH